jgi:hypothetical protein
MFKKIFTVWLTLALAILPLVGTKMNAAGDYTAGINTAGSTGTIGF